MVSQEFPQTSGDLTAHATHFKMLILEQYDLVAFIINMGLKLEASL